MKVVNRTPKRIEIENAYSKSKFNSIFSCYKKPGEAKIDAYYDCIKDMMSLSVFNLEYKIISYNRYMFTFGGYYRKYFDTYYETWFYYRSPARAETWLVSTKKRGV